MTLLQGSRKSGSEEPPRDVRLKITPYLVREVKKKQFLYIFTATRDEDRSGRGLQENGCQFSRERQIVTDVERPRENLVISKRQCNQ